MFIILSCPRSGSTLLAQCLHAHGDIAIPDESDFIVPTAFVLERIRDQETGREIIARLIPGTARFKPSLGEYLTVGEINDIVHSAEYTLSGILTSIYNAVASKAGKKLVGDKSPNDLQYSGLFAGLGLFNSEEIKIVHLIRDVRDVLASVNRLGWLDDPMWYPRPWNNMNLALYRRLKDQPSRYMLVRYEDLVTEPMDVLSKLCGFLGVDYRGEMLSPSKRNPRHKGQHPHENLYKDISTRTVGRYKTDLAPEITAECETRAREAMDVFGYERSGGTSILKKLFR